MGIYYFKISWHTWHWPAYRDGAMPFRRDLPATTRIVSFQAKDRRDAAYDDMFSVGLKQNRNTIIVGPLFMANLSLSTPIYPYFVSFLRSVQVKYWTDSTEQTPFPWRFVPRNRDIIWRLDCFSSWKHAFVIVLKTYMQVSEQVIT